MTSNVVNMKEMVENRVKQTENISGEKKVDPGTQGKKTGGSGSGIDSDFIMDCLNKNELGDGELFKKLYRNDFVLNLSMGSWMQWKGSYWEVDKNAAMALASVEGVANVYHDEKKRLIQKKMNLESKGEDSGFLNAKIKMLSKRIQALYTDRRRKNCLKFAYTSDSPLAIDGVEIDQKPWLLPCKNGVINLKTGEREQGYQDSFLSKHGPLTLPEDWFESKCPVWEKFLDEIFLENDQLIHFVQRLLGLSLIGKVIEHIFIVLSGRGRNGKGVLCNTIHGVLGPLAGQIRPEMMLDQGRIQSSAGPSPDIMALRGQRVSIASELDKHAKGSPAKIKMLSGGDMLCARNPNDKYEVNFQPSHTLFLQTNNDPHVPGDDFAFWERMIKIPFTLSYVNREPRKDFERKADPYLQDKLKTEYPAILAWMVKGCLEYQRIGLAKPLVVKQAIEEYRQDEDVTGDFIRECCVLGDDYRINATKFYDAFSEWWQINISNKVPKMKAFGTMLGDKFKKKKSSTVTYYGVKLLPAFDSSQETNQMFID